MIKTKNKGNKRLYRSVSEFEKKFFPKSLEKKTAEKTTDAQTLGASLAKETLEVIKIGLSGKLPN